MNEACYNHITILTNLTEVVHKSKRSWIVIFGWTVTKLKIWMGILVGPLIIIFSDKKTGLKSIYR